MHRYHRVALSANTFDDFRFEEELALSDKIVPGAKISLDQSTDRLHRIYNPRFTKTKTKDEDVQLPESYEFHRSPNFKSLISHGPGSTTYYYEAGFANLLNDRRLNEQGTEPRQ